MTEADLNSVPFTHRQTQTDAAASASMADCQYWFAGKFLAVVGSRVIRLFLSSKKVAVDISISVAQSVRDAISTGIITIRLT